MYSWQPTANFTTLQARAQLYQQIRTFFAQRQVLEVETPILSAACVPDTQIEPFVTQYHGDRVQPLFLQTSPELAMKRLVAAHRSSIYQISKAFRDGESGRWHNPEFTLLEWYRIDFSKQDLIQEVDELLQTILGCAPALAISYCELFEKYANLHPLNAPLSQLQHFITRYHIDHIETLDRDTCLQLILSHHIEEQLGYKQPIVITDFPATQAALARKQVDNPALAERFEFYVQGIELANGFYELTDAIEQRQRFEQSLQARATENKPLYPIDEHFLAALEAGLPTCSGVALGVDRLLMLLVKATHINQVLNFPLANA